MQGKIRGGAAGVEREKIYVLISMVTGSSLLALQDHIRCEIMAPANVLMCVEGCGGGR